MLDFSTWITVSLFAAVELSLVWLLYILFYYAPDKLYVEDWFTVASGIDVYD